MMDHVIIVPYELGQKLYFLPPIEKEDVAQIIEDWSIEDLKFRPDKPAIFCFLRNDDTFRRFLQFGEYVMYYAEGDGEDEEEPDENELTELAVSTIADFWQYVYENGAELVGQEVIDDGRK